MTPAGTIGARRAVDRRCALCDSPDLEIFLEVAAVPVVGTAVWPSASQARSAPSGDLVLAFCGACGAIRNLDFDEAVVPYDATYEASQFFSPSFAAYARELAQRLVDQHQLRGGLVVEIGSGKGEFLGLLSELGDLEGIGFDPTYDGEVDGAIDANRVRFVRAFYDEDHATPRADLVVCRHVLEHLADPAVLLRSVAATIGARAVPVYFEVPNVGFVLSPAGMWDLIYPHVTYFSPPTLRWLFERCGFDVERIQTAFDDQFVVVDGRARAGRSTPPLPDPAAIATLRDQVHAFAAVFRSTIDRWSRLVHERAATGGEVVVWGAGAKGVTFLNLMPAGRGVSLVVDRNPRKHGTYISGTGQEVVPPDALRGRSIDTVIVMNRLYEDEIRAELADLDLAPTIVTV